ncbi:amidohydrolase family protein [Mycolicibacterium sp. 050158]|uniref:amidohydrolase family protein n=1 Tax=Mycolicibacterium sp. 050158 TaxID=3090602 RepID=UPI00299D6010|nr:amidohydrolase family protein [Mycolicibacterium sp. 050158]MDX1893061.1 amidohydrolase family protein [Mycolicibacterium sp. 050158]
MKVVDAHHHLWDPQIGEYPWMAGDFEPLRRRYDVSDLRPYLVANDVVATIVVQVRADLAETVDLLELASRTAEVVGVVGWVDLTSADVSGQIALLREGIGGEQLVGLRHAVADESDPRWLLRDDVDAAMRKVAASGLAFDLEITSRELAAADTLVRRHADVRFVVDHGAKPPIATGWSQDWADGLAALAEKPNVWCKLSGLVTEASWSGWRVEDLQPYVDHLLDTFGVSRLMFGSDWPVCELAARYDHVLAAATVTLAALSDDDRRHVMYQNALTVYRPPRMNLRKVHS